MPDKKYYRAFFLESNAGANANSDAIRTATNTYTDGTGAETQNNK